MDAKYIAIAVPVFVLTMALEHGVTSLRGKPTYRFSDSITNLACGMGQQIIGVFTRLVTVGIYVFVYENCRLFTFSSSSVLAWIALLFGVDLCYYAFHRASHRVNFIWAGHAVHHQSEEYNLSVALRQSWFVQLVAWAFYIPLAVLGFPPLMFLTMTTLNTLYQFWIHTRTIGHLGPLEWVLNTPSHHRVHHGIDPRYIDKNYAGIFILWDRLFGTFLKEDSEPVYGTVKPLSSWSSLYANVEPLIHIARLSKAAYKTGRTLPQKLLLSAAAWVMPPEWRPASLGGNVTIPETSRDTQVRYDRKATASVVYYVALHYLLALAAFTAFLWYQGTFPQLPMAALGGLLLLSLISFGGLLENQRWGQVLEVGRLILVLPVLLLFTQQTPILLGTVLVVVGSAIQASRLATR